MSQQQRQCNPQLKLVTKPSRRIVLPINRDSYPKLVKDAAMFRAYLERMQTQHPELFPADIGGGYTLHDTRRSKKLPDMAIRRIRLNRTGAVYRVVPSFVLPYMTGYTDEVEKALYLRRFGVPFWGLTYVFGRNDMYWYRLVEHLGRYDLVGSTVKAPERLPQHLLADEKFTDLNGQETFIATTVGSDVILAVAVSLDADVKELTAAYGEFKREALRLNPAYQPQTVNIDGWKQTWAAWQTLFPLIVVIRCFLHAFLRIRDRCQRLPIAPQVYKLAWRIYHAGYERAYYRAFTRFLAFAEAHLSGEAFKAVQRFKRKRADLRRGLDYPGCHRISTMLERPMQWMTRCLYMARDFHGHRTSAHLNMRGWALLHNFLPYCPRAHLRSQSPFTSPFHKLNGYLYHDHWPHNLLAATSCQAVYYHQKR